MNFCRVKENKKQYLPLLLLADEQEDMIDRYLSRGEMIIGVLDAATVSVCVFTDEGEGVCEIKNLAVTPDYQGRGIGHAMIAHVARCAKGTSRVLRVGTGADTSTVDFYKKCGFRETVRIKNFFTDHYDSPIIEDGILLRDMQMLEMPL